ncbi:MAG: exodeoxyribonuclease III [Gammaproteobacteria bacterium]|jgi:exodeoxyribonuclease III|nr:exodeoxyribonuclease III [Gammaproteobacteria bacterium]MBT7370316.1 exodeoxyribonuclease III [Gammaproteobacteria bacterium]
MRIVSWNVNGLRACTRKGFGKFLKTCKADVLCLQEVRAFPEQLDDNIRSPRGWHTHFFPAERPGYSGVAIYSRAQPTHVATSLGDSSFDIEGRFLMVRFGRLSVASVYFPKGSGKDRDNSRVPYKLDFYAAVKEKIELARKLGPVYVTGDYNTAHESIDLARPKTNRKSSGFLPEERDVLTKWMEDGWVDVFRDRHPNEPDHYSWWRQWGNAREDNVGWRIDYVLASPSGAKRVSDAFIWPKVTGSDHCPVGVDLSA